MKELPHRHIGIVLVKCQGETYKGTGLLISPNLVLTCAQNVKPSVDYDPQPKDIFFFLNQHGVLDL